MRDPRQSPVNTLLEHLAPSLINIAPERSAEIEELLSGVTFVVTDDGGLAFSADPVKRDIQIPVRGVEFLWVQSYALWVLQAYHLGGSQAQIIELAQHQNTVGLPTLLRWAIDNELCSAPDPWPIGTPRPSAISYPPPVLPSDERVASEIALCGVAWILHHELAHITLSHPATSPISVQDEVEADRAATDWILDRAPEGYARIKRAFGVGVATVSLGALELHAPQSRKKTRTHPHPAERIDRAFRHPALAGEDAAHAAAGTLLCLHLAAAGHPVDLTGGYDTAQDYLADACSVLRKAFD